MSEELAIFDKEKTVKDLKDVNKEIDNSIRKVEELIAKFREASAGFSRGTPREFTNAANQGADAMNRARNATDDLGAAERRLAQIERNLAIQRSALSEEINRQSVTLRQLTAANREHAQEQLRLESLTDRERQRLGNTVQVYSAVQRRLNALQLEYRNLATAKQLGMRLTDQETARMQQLERQIQRYDQTLKAVDASMGIHRRNVGNYAGAFNPLNNSIAQITREMPAFTYSVQTGFMAISNNLPIFFDALKAAREQNRQLRLEGQATVPVWKQLGNAIFSWNTLLSIAITLLTVYGKEIGIWIQKMINAGKAIDKAKLAQEDYNQALKGTDFKKAVREVSEMTTYIELARQGFMNKKKVLDFYNESLGKVLGTAKSLNEIEELLAKNADNYIKATLYKAAANMALDKSAEEMIKAEETRRKKLEDFKNNIVDARLGGGIGGFGGTTFNPAQYDEETKRIAKAQQERKNQEIKASEDAAKAQEDIAKDFMKKATTYAKGLNFDFLLPKEKKPKQYSGAKLTGEQKDYLNTLQAEKDNAIAIQKQKRINLEIDEKEYWENYIKIIQGYRTKIEVYLKGSNAKEKQVEAAARRRGIDELEKANKEIYDYEKKNLEETYKMRSTILDRESKNVEKNDYFSNTDRVTKQIDIDNKLIKQAEEYYEEQIVLASKAAESTIEWERKRDEEIGKIQDSRAIKVKSLAEAFKADLETQTEYNRNYQKLTYEQQKSVILSDKKLTVSEREYRLNVLDKNNQIEQNKIELQRLETLKLQLKSKIAIAQMWGVTNKNDIKNLEDLQQQIDGLTNSNASLNLELKTNYDTKTKGIRDAIIGGLNDMGLNHVADQFSLMFDRIMDKTADWKDYTLLATTAVLQGLNTLSDEGKKKRIAALDEELKKTQENTDLEISFITSRIDMLNGLDELSKEQISERNRLEDEARTLREQQQQREKLIAIQKAKAEQRASAQQAIINGLLAATTTLAQLGIPAGIFPAAIAAGLGVANAALIMAKDPTPQYYVGRRHGPSEWAWTQERGREIITDKNDNIKSIGSNSGPKMTWLDEGDKVITASKTSAILNNIGKMPKIGENVYKKAAMSALMTPVFINNKNENNSKIMVDEMSRQFERVARKYFNNDRIVKERGKIFKYTGANNKVKIGTYDIKKAGENYDSTN